MSVQVLISAYRDSIHRVPAVIATLPSDIDVLVLHQNPYSTASAAYTRELYRGAVDYQAHRGQLGAG
jgi:hypothetical protein